MASIQILELSPAETPMEDLSYDITGNIAGGGFVRDLVDQAFGLVRDVLAFCRDAGSEDPVLCVIDIFNAIDAFL